MLVRQFKDVVHPTLLQVVGPGPLEHESQLPCVIGYILGLDADPDKLICRGVAAESVKQISLRQVADGSIDCFIHSGIAALQIIQVLLLGRLNIRSHGFYSRARTVTVSI